MLLVLSVVLAWSLNCLRMVGVSRSYPKHNLYREQVWENCEDWKCSQSEWIDCVIVNWSKEWLLVIRVLTLGYVGNNRQPIKAIILLSCWWKLLHVFTIVYNLIKECMNVPWRGYQRVRANFFHTLSLNEEKWILNPRADYCLEVELNLTNNQTMLSIIDCALLWETMRKWGIVN